MAQTGEKCPQKCNWQITSTKLQPCLPSDWQRTAILCMAAVQFPYGKLRSLQISNLQARSLPGYYRHNKGNT